MKAATSTGATKAGTKLHLRLGLVIGVVLNATALLEVTLRAAELGDHFYPTSFEFESSNKQVLDAFLAQSDELLPVFGRAAINTSDLREYRPRPIFTK